MSDTTEHDDERLRYAGGTTRHEGPGDEPKKLTPTSIDELGVDDIEPGVGSADDHSNHRKQQD